MEVYETEDEIRRLVRWLNEGGQREGPLRAALLRAFPAMRSESVGKSSERKGEIAAKEEASPGGEASRGSLGETGEGRGHGEAEADGVSVSRGAVAEGVEGGRGGDGVGVEDGDRGQGERSGESCGGSDAAAAASAVPGAAADGAGASAEASSAGGRGDRRKGGRGARGGDEKKAALASSKRCQELPRLLEEGAVELRMSGNQPAPVVRAEPGNDAEGDEVRGVKQGSRAEMRRRARQVAVSKRPGMGTAASFWSFIVDQCARCSSCRVVLRVFRWTRERVRFVEG